MSYDIKEAIIRYISIHKGLKYNSLMNKIQEDNLTSDLSEISKAIHESVQENKIIRIEYQVPDYSTIFSFYLPSGSKIL